MRFRPSIAAATLMALLAALLSITPASAGGVGTPVSGRLTSAGVGMADTSVYIFSGGDPSWSYLASTYTDSDGYYSYNLPPGDYRFGGFPNGRSPQYYPDAATVDTAQTVKVGTDPVTGIDIAFPSLPTFSGRAMHNGSPVDHAEVWLYSQLPSNGPADSVWSQYSRTYTSADGTFLVPAKPDTYVVMVGQRGYASTWVGGTDLNSATRFTVGSGNTALGDIPISDRTSVWGDVAGQQLSYCRDNVVDGTYAHQVPLQFSPQFYGPAQTTLWLNQNGTLTFGDPNSDTPWYTIEYAGHPTLAPFWSQLDTSAPGSADPSYGWSADGKTLCVLWDGVGRKVGRDDDLNTFQMLMVDKSGAPGRAAGDFDIVYDYDSIEWDESAQQAENRYPATVGYSAGTQVPGTWVQLPGSKTHGAFINGGPKALISHSVNSSQTGRYIYEIRNGQLHNGSGTGEVTDEASNPVQGALVSACPDDPAVGRCQSASTGADGRYTFSNLAPGAYHATVSPPANTYLFTTGGVSFTVVADTETPIPLLGLLNPLPLPVDTFITHHSTLGNGVPVVYWGEDLELRTESCAGGSASYNMRQGASIVRSGSMTELPAGTYSATLPRLTPLHGQAEIEIIIDCPDGSSHSVTFDLYIDPSGNVVDQYGPVSGATVTLSRSDTETGTYAVVPDGDPIMSPSNRKNPDLSTDSGHFGWDVIPGWYTVTAEKAGCSTATTPVMQVPPPQLDLLITLSCDKPTPTVAPKITGEAKVGQTLTVEHGTWPVGIEVVEKHWLRDGSEIGGATGHTYQVTDADAGKSLSVRLKLQRTGFSAFHTETASVKVAASPAPPPNPDRGAQNVKGKVPKKVKVKRTAKLPKITDASQKVTWKTLTKKTCKLSAGKVKGVKKGKCRLQATAPETNAWLALSKTYSVKIK